MLRTQIQRTHLHTQYFTSFSRNPRDFHKQTPCSTHYIYFDHYTYIHMCNQMLLSSYHLYLCCIMANLNDLKGLKFVSINTNSLNLSSWQSLINSLNLFNQKLKGILSLNADIICLQDVRLGSEGKQILQKSLYFNKYSCYKLYANSSSNKRGVTILFEFTIQFLLCPPLPWFLCLIHSSFWTYDLCFWCFSPTSVAAYLPLHLWDVFFSYPLPGFCSSWSQGVALLLFYQFSTPSGSSSALTPALQPAP